MTPQELEAAVQSRLPPGYTISHVELMEENGEEWYRAIVYYKNSAVYFSARIVKGAYAAASLAEDAVKAVLRYNMLIRLPHTNAESH